MSSPHHATASNNSASNTAGMQKTRYEQQNGSNFTFGSGDSKEAIPSRQNIQFSNPSNIVSTSPPLVLTIPQLNPSLAAQSTIHTVHIPQLHTVHARSPIQPSTPVLSSPLPPPPSTKSTNPLTPKFSSSPPSQYPHSSILVTLPITPCTSPRVPSPHHRRHQLLTPVFTPRPKVLCHPSSTKKDTTSSIHTHPPSYPSKYHRHYHRRQNIYSDFLCCPSQNKSGSGNEDQLFKSL